MPAFLVLDSISLATPDGRPLFDGLTLALGRERTGLVGRNGSGKSTLLRLIAGEIEAAGGSRQRLGSIGMLAQLTDERLTVDEALGVAGGLARLRRLERGKGSIDDAAEADWTLEARIQAAMAEAGLPSLPPHRPIRSLSGGERTRLGTGAPPGRGAGSAAAGRAHQQSRRGRPPGRGAAARTLAGRRPRRQPRPRPPGTRRPHRRTDAGRHQHIRRRVVRLCRGARGGPRPRRRRPRPRLGRLAQHRTRTLQKARGKEGAPRQGRPRLARQGRRGQDVHGPRKGARREQRRTRKPARRPPDRRARRSAAKRPGHRSRS